MLIESLSAVDAISFLAYLDPSLGSIHFQIVVAGILSAGFFIKSHLIQARHLIGRVWKRGG